MVQGNSMPRKFFFFFCNFSSSHSSNMDNWDRRGSKPGAASSHPSESPVIAKFTSREEPGRGARGDKPLGRSQGEKKLARNWGGGARGDNSQGRSRWGRSRGEEPGMSQGGATWGRGKEAESGGGARCVDQMSALMVSDSNVARGVHQKVCTLVTVMCYDSVFCYKWWVCFHISQCVE